MRRSKTCCAVLVLLLLAVQASASVVVVGSAPALITRSDAATGYVVSAATPVTVGGGIFLTADGYPVVRGPERGRVAYVAGVVPPVMYALPAYGCAPVPMVMGGAATVWQGGQQVVPFAGPAIPAGAVVQPYGAAVPSVVVR